ncbi:type I-E CRISPR-associated protein Cse2/CasB [Peptococcus simiae]|uniref:Type I-E CRISPR-associated protein Cse2/CasB n=1 Tax=Peptococcus simiae TaxID=1643805 RepID=A0ABW9GY69_9FIRM
MSEAKKQLPSVAGVTAAILHEISSSLGSSATKATLAALRHSIGKEASASIDIWPLLFEKLPEAYIGRGRALSHEERTILNTLQLYALHQQGNDQSVWLEQETKDRENTGHGKGKKQRNNIGDALKLLRRGDDSLAVDRRFNALVTSTDYDELIHHLRQMVKLLRAKKDGKIDYPALASDLYWFSRGYEESVRLNWSRHYYRFETKGQENND